MDSQSAGNNIPLGGLKASTPNGEYNRVLFAIKQALGKMQTATLVRIDAVTNAGELAPVGFVDVTPLVNQLDGEGNPIPHITVHNIPYLRIQGGTNAIIIDPQKGDIGICVFASRDISKIKSTKRQANPGSFRTFDFADGLYMGGVLNGEPVQFVQFNADGVTIRSPLKVTVDAPLAHFTGNVTVDGYVHAVDDVVGKGISLHDHKHTGVQSGPTVTGTPQT